VLDEILDLFDRDKKKSGAPKQGGVRGLLTRLNGDDDDHRSYNDQPRRYDDDEDRRNYDEQPRRYDDDDDYRDGRSKPHKKRREFDFFGDDD
jgi:hypothetical protein